MQRLEIPWTKAFRNGKIPLAQFTFAVSINIIQLPKKIGILGLHRR